MEKPYLKYRDEAFYLKRLLCDRGLFKCGDREIMAIRFFKLDLDLSLSQMVVLSPPISVIK